MPTDSNPKRVKKEVDEGERPPSVRVKREEPEPAVKREEKPLSASEVVAAAAAQVKTEPQEPELQRRRAAKNDDDDDEEEAAAAADDEALAQSIDRSRSCPYLDTINRAYLDFDFEKLCSVSMSNQSVYACLICGKYYQGRGKGTHAYMHSLEEGHHVYLNLHTLKFYCLPDNYEVIDPSLDDIKFVVRPTFSESHIASLDTQSKPSRALDGTTYFPGLMGLNNIKANDYVNVVVQLLNRVAPFRDFLLRQKNTVRVNDALVQVLAELFHKINNPRAFKSHVSPHEFLQAVSRASKKAFTLTEQNDPFQLLSWLLNTLDNKLQRHGKTIVKDTFQGRVKITTRKLPPTKDQQEVSGIHIDPTSAEWQEKVAEQPFVVLGLDLPPPPLFQDERKQNMIPQVPLFELLNKYDGISEHEYKTYKDTFLKRFQLLDMPNYLVLHVKRFTKNAFFVEKNPTIVNFPVKNLDFSDYVAESHRIAGKSYRYNLVCNIVHDGQPGAGKGTYRAHVYHKGTRQWHEIQDLHVANMLPEMITLSESYIQVWERQSELDAKPGTAQAPVKMETSA